MIAAAIASGPAIQNLAERVLGPTADYVGEAIPRLPARARANVEAVFSKAYRKAGDATDGEQVPARVLKAVWDDAQVADDELRQDYLAGVLASARSENGRDDRAAAQASIVAALSTYALRTHYLLYAALQRLTVGKDSDVLRLGRINEPYFVRADEYAAGMAFSESEDDNYAELLLNSIQGLQRFGLISNYFSSGSPEHLCGKVNRVVFPAVGFVWHPNPAGAYFLGTVVGIRQRIDEAWVGSPEQFTLEAGPSLPALVPVDTLPPVTS